MTERTTQVAIPELLERWADGDGEALDRLMPLVVEELRRIAAACLRDERATHTLQPTTLVNELYLRMAGGASVRLRDRRQFLQFASQTVRRILVDHARSRATKKRSGRRHQVALDVVAELFSPPPDLDVLALHEALQRLEASSPRRVRIVELRFFGDLSMEEIAELLDVSVSTVRREWTSARAFLLRELG